MALTPLTAKTTQVEMYFLSSINKIQRYHYETLPRLGPRVALSISQQQLLNEGIYMKTFIVISILALSCSSFAWTSHDAVQKEYHFSFKLADEKLDITRTADTYEDAYDAAAQQCFKFFAGSKSLKEDKGLDIIDACANPRS